MGDDVELYYEFDGLPLGPSLNDRGDRLNGWRAREASRKAHAAMREKINATPRPSLYPLKGPFEMEVTFWLGTRRNRDGRNLSMQIKPYEDELVAAGIIVDDGWQTIPDHVVRLRYRKGWPGFAIRLRKLDAQLP